MNIWPLIHGEDLCACISDPKWHPWSAGPILMILKLNCGYRKSASDRSLTLLWCNDLDKSDHLAEPAMLSATYSRLCCQTIKALQCQDKQAQIALRCCTEASIKWQWLQGGVCAELLHSHLGAVANCGCISTDPCPQTINLVLNRSSWHSDDLQLQNHVYPELSSF